MHGEHQDMLTLTISMKTIDGSSNDNYNNQKNQIPISSYKGDYT